MWKQITLDVPEDLKDALIGELSEDGFAGVWEGEDERRGLTRFVFYFGFRSNLDLVEERIRELFHRSALVMPEISRTVVEECDWTEEWKKSYSSFPIGKSFFVIPSWIDAVCPDDRLPMWIDPGQAFGTGTHETTQLTMEALERWVGSQHIVLDVGTGSGILAMSSRMLGAKEVIACDIDSVAVQVALANIQRNDEPEVWTFCGSIEAIGSDTIDLLLANLTADVIVELFPEFRRALKATGIAILSGILNEQSEDVEELCRQSDFTIHEKIVRGEWLALVIEKHGG